MQRPRSTVVVTTYEEPERLALVLLALARQSVAPDEIFVADDGSGAATTRVVEAFRPPPGTRFERVWHEDRGFRKWAVSNEAVRRSTGERLLFLDGDSLPHRRWVEDHLAWSARGDVLCGRRVKLGPRFTQRVARADVESGALERLWGPVTWHGFFGDNERVLLGLRLPSPIAALLHPRPRKLMGVNFSVARRAFEAVNGYDEEWPGRRGDRDLDLRLARSGARFVALLNRAIVYHLHHLERPNSAAIEERVRAEERSTRVRCAVGLVRDAAPAEASTPARARA